MSRGNNNATSRSDIVFDYEEIPGAWVGSQQFVKTPKPERNWRKCIILFYVIAFPILAFFIGKVVGLKANVLFSISSSGSSESGEFGILISNEYGTSTLTSAAYGLTETIVEPHRITYLTVDSASSSYDYEWFVDSWSVGSGSNVSVLIPGSAGKTHNITIVIYKKSSTKVHDTLTEIVLAKYVRREIRGLLAQDRVAFFQAMSIMQRVPTVIGQALYGSNYYSRDHFNRMHLYFGGSQDCDHWHDGPGFVVTHFAFSLMFEKSLQAINPSISLPYWDFTLESTFFDASSFRSSFMFSDDWFGSENKDSYMIQQGRFGKVIIMQNANNYSSLINSYGMLRAPWNSNPAAYLTRSSLIYDLTNDLKPTGCQEYFTTLTTRDWLTFASRMNTIAHGYVHELTGGSWGFTQTTTTLSSHTKTVAIRKAVYTFAHSSERYSKILWRNKYMECPNFSNSTVSEKCKATTDSTFVVLSECKCQCTTALWSLSGKDLATLFYSLRILNGLTFFDLTTDTVISTLLNKRGDGAAWPIQGGYTEAQSVTIYESLRSLLCDFGVLGDMFQATSTNDPLFWVLHPNMERLWHIMKLNQYNNRVSFDDNWDSDLAKSKYTCAGHQSSHASTFSKAVFGEDGDGVYSNEELYNLLHPARKELPYVYDTLSWPHCELLGFNLTGF